MAMGRLDRAHTPGLRNATSDLLATGALLATGGGHAGSETPSIPNVGRAVTTHHSSGVRPRQEAVSWRLALVPA